MTHIYPKAFFENKVISFEDAHLSIASSAVLYGLSVYTVFPLVYKDQKTYVFRLKDHYERLINSANIIGIDTFEHEWTFEKFKHTVTELVQANDIKENVFVRATVHVSDLVAGTKSRGLKTVLSVFIYEAKPIIPQDGVRLKTSAWRRVPDNAIPSRAKVNGAYVNSVLGKQDALDSGYDDCLFLDGQGHVCELSAANIFMVRDGVLITPSSASDILEGINRKTILEIAHSEHIPTKEQTIDMTELYIADEVFVCGTSSYIAPVIEIDKRKIGRADNLITQRIKQKHQELFRIEGPFAEKYFELIG